MIKRTSDRTMKNSSKLYLPYITHRSHLKMQLFLMCICVAIGSIRSLFENCVDSKLSDTKNGYTDIDPDHLAEYPYCGSMDIEYTDEPEPSVRAVNTNETDDLSSYRIYRWLVLLKTEIWKTDGSPDPEVSQCTGAIITER